MMPRRRSVFDDGEVVPVRDVEEVQLNKHTTFGFVIYLKIDGESFRISKNDLVQALQHSTLHLSVKPARGNTSNIGAFRQLEAYGSAPKKSKRTVNKFESTVGE